MDKEKLAEFVKSLIPNSEINQGKNYVEVSVGFADLFSAAKALHDNGETSFDFLISISGIDYPTDMALVYHLESTRFRHMIVLKIRRLFLDSSWGFPLRKDYVDDINIVRK